MNSLKYSFATLLTAILFIGLSNTTMAQDRAAAVDAYNEARELAQNGQYDQSISAYSEAMSAAQQLGEEGQDIIERVENALPQIYFQRALSVYESFKNQQTANNLNSAISSFESAADIASQYGDTEITGQAEGVITQLNYTMSVLQFKQENYEEALATINNVIEQNPDYAQAYYHKGLIVKNQETSTESYLAAIDEAIEVAERVGETQVAREASESASAELVYRGAQRVENENYSGAITLLEQALNYNPESSNAYFRLAQAYNARGDWDAAINNAGQALENASGGRTTQAKIYFELGNAYKGAGEYDEACDAYSNAAYGQFRANSEHQMEFVLECESQ